MSRVNFTKKFLETLAAPKGDDYVVYRDSHTRGLGIKIEPTGHRTYFWSRRTSGKLEWKTIGEFESLSIEEARAKASEYNTVRDKWKRDPSSGENPFARPEALTLGEVIAAYTDRHVRHKAAHPDRAAKSVEWQVEHYLSSWRDKKIVTIRRGEILKLREAVHKKHGLYSANRLVQLLRAAINWSIDEAELWKGPNPASEIGLFKETKRQRFLLEPELAALWKALQAPETSADLRHYVLLALLTGARKGDVLSMKWDDVSLDHATWRVPEPKGAEPYTVALTVEAVKILEERKAIAAEMREKGVASPWVFTSFNLKGEVSHVSDLKKSWKKLLERAGISSLRQHDLRRTLGSWQAAGGASLSVIGKSLGHKSIGSTQVYAQLQLDPIRASVEAATQAMFAAATAAPEKPKLLPARRKRA